MQRIADGKARMRPAWHFGLLTILWTLGILIVLFTTILLVSFIIFTMRQTGAMSAPAFGLRGLSPLLSAIPWLLVVFSGLGVLVLELLSRHFAFAYRKPLLRTLALIVGLAVIGGVLFARTPMHQRLFDRAARGGLPIAGPMYQRYGFGADGAIHPGIITSLSGGVMTLSSRRGASITVRITDATDVADDVLAVGRPVIVLGERDGASINALGIIAAPEDMLWSVTASAGMPMRMHLYPPAP